MTFENKHIHIANATDSNIKKVQCTKFLGLCIDGQLKWTTHIKHCQSKLSSSLYALRTAKHLLTSRMKTLYYSMIHPYLDYRVMLWGSASKRDNKSIEILQKKAIRIIMNATYNAHARTLFKNVGLLTFTDIYQLHIYKFMYALAHNTLSSNFIYIYIFTFLIYSSYIFSCCSITRL
jgi:hypothetical protein